MDIIRVLAQHVQSFLAPDPPPKKWIQDPPTALIIGAVLLVLMMSIYAYNSSGHSLRFLDTIQWLRRSSKRLVTSSTNTDISWDDSISNAILEELQTLQSLVKQLSEQKATFDRNTELRADEQTRCDTLNEWISKTKDNVKSLRETIDSMNDYHENVKELCANKIQQCSEFMNQNKESLNGLGTKEPVKLQRCSEPQIAVDARAFVKSPPLDVERKQSVKPKRKSVPMLVPRRQ